MISGRFALRIICAARSIASAGATGIATGCLATGGRSPDSWPATSSGNSSSTGPGRSSCATRNASRTIVGNHRRRHDLPRHLGQRLHRGDHVDDLELRLMRRHDRLLPRQQHHRHRAQLRIRGAGREVQRARPQRRDADSGATGEPAVRRRHERRRLLVPRQHQLDLRIAQRFDDIQVLFTRHAENAVDAFVLECLDQ
jgi:hypothetical protein